MMPRGVETNGAAIRKQRFLRGWDQGALADRAGYTMRTIQRAEYGGPVRITTLAHIAQALGCEVADLLAPSMTRTTSIAS